MSFLPLLIVLLSGCVAVRMPPKRSSAAPAGLANELRRTVKVLSEDIDERNCYTPRGLARAEQWIAAELRGYGLTPRLEDVPVTGIKTPPPVRLAHNVIAEVKGTSSPDELIVIGAHYDSRCAHEGWHDHEKVLPDAQGTPGANDNASGVAATLALAKRFARDPQPRTIRFCFWVNEEPPFYQTDSMGSLVSAKNSRRKGEKIKAMISLETLGCYSPQPQTKRHKDYGPLPNLVGLPTEPNYVAFLCVWPSGFLARQSASLFSQHSSIPVQTFSLAPLHHSFAWSDDWSYHNQGFPAFCVTDTAFLRADHYHELTDRLEHMDFEPFAEVVAGLKPMIAALASR